MLQLTSAAFRGLSGRKRAEGFVSRLDRGAPPRQNDGMTNLETMIENQAAETDPVRLRALADKARRLAGGVQNEIARERLLAAAAEYEQRAKEVEMDDLTDQ